MLTQRLTGLIAGALLLLTPAVYASDVSDYRGSWEYRALSHQSEIDRNAPFGKASFLTTHNSYNAGVYSQNGSYIDPNHKISLTDQLQIGIRALELDVHHTFSSSGFWPWEWKFSQELKLSHANGDTGTHPNDRFFTQGLQEIRNWLNVNPDEVLIIYLEDHMEGHYDKAIGEMNGIIGDLVYKPGGCKRLPMDLSKADVLAAGKQILLIGGNCATTNWANYVFNGHFSSTESLENFVPCPTCTAGNKDVAYIQSHLVRIYEDSTTLSALFGDPGPPITADDAAQMAECGIGAIGLDQVVPFDSRLKAQIWSWGENEPNDAGGEDCAEQRSDGRFNDLPCSTMRCVACQNPSNGDWFITDGAYTWAEARTACDTEFPGEALVFGVPVNGYENALLRDLKTGLGIDAVWINYSDRLNEGQWVANPYDNRALGKPTAQSSTYNGTAHAAHAARAVDGNPNGNWAAGSVTHTNSDPNAWWQVDLGAQTDISRIELANRTDCCADRLSHFYLFISDAPMGNRPLADLLVDDSVTRHYQESLSETTLTLPVSAQGRYVKIQLDGTGILSLAEVEVYGE
ncbi:galactose-binding domain-containing protein [Desulfoluna spongiiphila]|uniref:galactose-binding domain-containing protein n=1 Tax=Desulfoluna spongiiphila TaxID=419481 RepID=UPI001254B41F|nr:discoidin domain-containing protein [Desulfoluna spongiiphila]VVS94678.1 fucolectin tachylectin-4 pentraxin-1 [Desulfoluna spongiiphila]